MTFHQYKSIPFDYGFRLKYSLGEIITISHMDRQPRYHNCSSISLSRRFWHASQGDVDFWKSNNLETLYFNKAYLYTYSTSNRKSLSYNQHLRRKNCDSSLTFELILFLSTPVTFFKRIIGPKTPKILPGIEPANLWLRRYPIHHGGLECSFIHTVFFLTELQETQWNTIWLRSNQRSKGASTEKYFKSRVNFPKAHCILLSHTAKCVETSCEPIVGKLLFPGPSSKALRM